VTNLLSCPRCGALPDEATGICPQCRTVMTPATDADEQTCLAGSPEDVTRLAQDSPRSGPGSTPERKSPSSGSPSSSSGWLSSSGAIDHGRFPPGTLLGGRYRIVGRLGRGGMGEVYRADDLKLGQPVALKFLPPEVDRDPARLTQLHTEVRMARQVSHPNVCRVYDIDEVDGYTFLSMEYVDGEDLASLLKRIGRFPEERGLEIARQICAGLAAAHERGVVHRDFKPANVMLDGTGKVRISDFGLAGVSGEAISAGTPAYMAPEQLSGGQVTSQSDIYALGLVLYELFTGQRALEGRNLAELIHKREQVGIVPPSAIVADLSPEIERAIHKCLRPDAATRPSTALAVAAILPGGDPLAAALAAGETPSPEIVAAAGGTAALSARAALAAAVWITVSLGAIVLLYDRVMLINRVPTPKTPAALEDRASEALARLGYGQDVVDTSHGLGFSLDYANFIRSTSTAPDRWTRLAGQRPESFLLWRRTSPRQLVPRADSGAVTSQDPPLNVGGMTLTVVDASGRLAEFVAVPMPVDEERPAQSVDWSVLFDAAGLQMSAFSPVAPGVVPPVYAGQRVAWEGKLPDQPEHAFRVEAAAQNGRPVYFVITGPWSRSSRAQPVRPTLFNVVIGSLATLVMPGLMVTAAVLARRNVTRGRGDRRGASRTATVVLVTSLTAWALSGVHVGSFSVDLQRFFLAIGRALFDAGLLWVTYLGLEPYVRRYSPDSLIGWTRLVAGQWRDPRVAADVAFGVSAGLAMTLSYALHNVLPPLAGRPEPMPMAMDAWILLGSGREISFMIGRVADAITSGMLAVVGVLALTLLLRHRWLAAPAAMICFLPVVVQGMFSPGTPVLDLAIGLAIIAILVMVILRIGLLAAIAALATHFILLRAPLTTDLGSWRGSAALWHLGVVLVAGIGACYLARSGRTGNIADSLIGD
jgi:serine/threonine-protein kinase